MERKESPGAGNGDCRGILKLPVAIRAITVATGPSILDWTCLPRKYNHNLRPPSPVHKYTMANKRGIYTPCKPNYARLGA